TAAIQGEENQPKLVSLNSETITKIQASPPAPKKKKATVQVESSLSELRSITITPPVTSSSGLSLNPQDRPSCSTVGSSLVPDKNESDRKKRKRVSEEKAENQQIERETKLKRSEERESSKEKVLQDGANEKAFRKSERSEETTNREEEREEE